MGNLCFKCGGRGRIAFVAYGERGYVECYVCKGAGYTYSRPVRTLESVSGRATAGLTAYVQFVLVVLLGIIIGYLVAGSMIATALGV